MASGWQGRVVLITGGTRGLGLEIARQLVGMGARVGLCARDEDELHATHEELAARGDVMCIRCDVADADQVREMVAAVRSGFGEIDVLIANAGVIAVGAAADQTLDDHRLAMDVMYWGVVNAVDAVLPRMRERHAGSIAVITSVGGKLAVPHLVSYAGAKFAAVGFAEGLAAEVRSDGVRITTVVPGLMRTGSSYRALFKGRRELEHSWFAVLASLPVVTVSAERAARRVIRAIEHGRTEVSIGVPAAVAARVHGVMPATTIRALGVAARLLPRPAGRAVPAEPGAAHTTSVTESALTALGRRAAGRYRQRQRSTT